MLERFLKLFLVNVLVLISLFGTISESKAALFENPFGDVSNRVRKYTDFNYTYDQIYGFQCRPDNIRHEYYAENNGELDNGLAAGLGIANVTTEILISPFVCEVIIRSFLKLGSGGAIFLTTLASLVTGSLDDLTSNFFGENDYSLDATNPMCLPTIIPMATICVGSSVILRIFKTSKPKAAAVYLGMGAFYSALKNIVSGVKYSQAQKAYSNLKICGDNWLTYGNEDFYDKIKLDGDIEKFVNSENRAIKEEYIKKYYPTKGAFFGSYKYFLNDCLLSRNIDSCTKLSSFKLSDTIKLIAGKNQKAYQFTENDAVYREYKYGGIEHAYSGCTDPRPEARSYDVNANVGNSFPSQLYYARGSEGINYACDRFLGKADWYNDYKCCIEASQRLVCVQYDKSYGFCNKTGNCELVSNDNELAKLGKQFYEEYAKLETSQTSCGSIIDECTECTDKEKNEVEQACQRTLQENKESIEKIKNGNNSKDKANFGIIKLKLFASKHQSNKYCVKTQSFCPYDFYINGGTETVGNQFKDEYEISKDETDIVNKGESLCYERDSEGKLKTLECIGKPSNFCQLDRHCVSITPYAEINQLNPSSPYIDKSCINMVGSSHHNDGYKTYNSYFRNPEVKQHLTAPIAECIIETAKNMLFNKAGFTACKNGDLPDENENCSEGIIFKKGDNLSKYDNLKDYNYVSTDILNNLRRKLENIVRVLLVLAVMLYGTSFVIFGGIFKKEEFFKFVAKLIIVMNLSLTTWWVNPIFNGVFSFSNNVINFTLNIVQIDHLNPTYENNKFDGCFFGYNKNFLNNNYESYENRNYIAFFDFIDCKISKYFGFDIGSMDIIVLMISFILLSTISIILLMPLLLIFSTLILLSIKVAYIFVVAMLTMIILLFMAPIMAPFILFKKTEKIFNEWVNKIIGYIFYPMFLIIATTMLFYLYDQYFVGQSMYVGTDNGPKRDLFCGKLCVSDYGNFMINKNASEDDINSSCVDNLRGKVVDLENESMLCMFKTGRTIQKNLGIFSLFTDFSMPVYYTIAFAWKLMFSNFVILFLILMFLDKILDGIINIGSTIFGASADANEIMSVSNFRAKLGQFFVSNFGKGMISNGFGMARYKIADKVARDKDKKELGHGSFARDEGDAKLKEGDTKGIDVNVDKEQSATESIDVNVDNDN